MGSLGSGFTSGCDLSCGCWELNSELLRHLPSSHKFLKALVLNCLTQIMFLLAHGHFSDFFLWLYITLQSPFGNFLNEVKLSLLKT